MIKKLLLIVFFSIFSVLSHAQTGGFVTINDFGLPTYPYQHTRFWLRGSTPAGSNPIMEFYGLSNIKMYTDTVVIPKLALREDASPNKLVWVDANGMLRAFTPNYLTTVSSSNITSALGYTPVPTTRTLTINGTSFDLSADRSWTITAPSQVNADWNANSGVAQILNKPSLFAYRNNAVVTNNPLIETFSGTVAGGAGNVTFNLTADGTSGGTALYTNVNFVVPFVNDASTNYTYAYTLSGDKKTLTVNVKATPAINVALLSLTLLGVPANVANGTTVTAIIIGN